MKTFSFLPLTLAAALMAAGELRGDPTPYMHTDPRLVYDAGRSDDFYTESALDTMKWKASTSASGSNIYYATNFTFGPAGSPAASSLIVNGHTLSTPDKGYYYSGGSISSVLRYGYGYYEILAQAGAGIGWTSTLAASGASNAMTLFSYNTSPQPKTFVHVTESAGYVSTFTGTNGYPAKNYRYSNFSLAPNRLSMSADAAWHYYGIDWTPREIIWYVDGAEKYRLNYSGPHSPVNVRLAVNSNSTDSASVDPNGSNGDTPAADTQFAVQYFRYWTKDYDVPRLESAIVQPVDVAGAAPTSLLAFNHQVFDWDGTKYLTRPGSPNPPATQPTAWGNASNPVYQYYVHGELATWACPGTPVATDVFVWNPAMYSPRQLQEDLGTAATVNKARYTVYSDGSTVIDTPTVDQINDGQQWRWLGVYAFAAGGRVGLSADNWTPELGVRAAAMQFRALGYFYDDFSAAPGGWSSSGGSWAPSSGVLVQSGTSAAGVDFYYRTTASSAADYFVRGKVKFAGASPARNIGLVGRYTSATSYYLLRLTPPTVAGTGYLLDLLRVTSAGSTVLASTTLATSIDPAVNFVDLHLFMQGGHLFGLAQGEVVIEVMDASPLTGAGSGGVRTFGGTAFFDQVGGGQ